MSRSIVITYRFNKGTSESSLSLSIELFERLSRHFGDKTEARTFCKRVASITAEDGNVKPSLAVQIDSYLELLGKERASDYDRVSIPCSNIISGKRIASPILIPKAIINILQERNYDPKKTVQEIFKAFKGNPHYAGANTSELIRLQLVTMLRSTNDI